MEHAARSRLAAGEYKEKTVRGPRGGDSYGANKYSSKRKASHWGSGDKASRERDRRATKRKADRKAERLAMEFETRALQAPHPQECAICLANEKTHLVFPCGARQGEHHSYHGFCEQCATAVVEQGRCALCRQVVVGLMPVTTAFFVGH